MARDRTHHLVDGEAAYKNRFEYVEKFHEPGLAPVRDESGAYHIQMDGSPAYSRRFLRAFGFYSNRAAVCSEDGWHHILSDGSDLYPERCSWVGNFQEGLCTVRDHDGFYRYLGLDGARKSEKIYLYAGDFKDGVAVVRDDDGLCTHVDKEEKPIHNNRYLDLDVYHKGYARACDSQGRFHIDLRGNPAYARRFSEVEPFYNGFALVKDSSNRTGVINENGEWIQTIAECPIELEWSRISGVLVGHWNSQAVAAAVRLGMIDMLAEGPASSDEISRKLELDKRATRKLLGVLRVLGLIESPKQDNIQLTRSGRLLAPNEARTLREGAFSWSAWNYEAWGSLDESIRTGTPSFDRIYGKPFFQWIEENPEKAEIYHDAMARYAIHDYEEIPKAHDFSGHKVLMDCGGGKGVLLSFILRENSKLRGMLFDLSTAIRSANKYLHKAGVLNRCNLVEGDFLKRIPKGADAIVMSRIIHDWDDERALQILQNCHDALPARGSLYVLELMMSKDTESDLGVVLDLNNFIMLGGRERTLDEYHQLLEAAGFRLVDVTEIKPTASLIISERID